MYPINLDVLYIRNVKEWFQHDGINPVVCLWLPRNWRIDIKCKWHHMCVINSCFTMALNVGRPIRLAEPKLLQSICTKQTNKKNANMVDD